MYKKLYLLILLVSIYSSSLFAQVSGYSFTSTSLTYNAVSGGTILGTSTNDESVFNNSVTGVYNATATNTGFAIGFNFTYNGIGYDKFAVCTNGYIVLGTGTFSIANLTQGIIGTSNTAGYANVVTAFNQDLEGTAALGSELSYQTTGTTGSRVLIIQWKNYRVYGTAGTVLNFQIRLNEANNSIDFVYGTMTGIATNKNAQVGLRGANNADFNARTTISNWTTTTAAATNTNDCTFSSTVFPASGLTFSFVAPAPCTVSPTAGTTQSTSSSGCSGTAFTLTVTGDSGGAGLNYQWQMSTDNTNWVDITGATGASYSFANGINITTYFRRKITCSNQSAFSTAFLYTVNGTIVYASLPFTETFENTWVNSSCGTRDVPTNNWRNTPATGDNSWRREDDGTAASWTNLAFGSYSPAGAAASLHSARYHSRSTALNGFFDVFVNCTSGNAAKELKFDFINANGVDSLTILLSVDGGNSFTQVDKLGVSTAATWTNKVYSFTSTSATTIVRFLANGDYGSSDIGIDNINVYSVNCGMIAGATISSITSTTANASWTALPSVIGYNWEVRTTGLPGNPGAVTSGNTTASNINITGLGAATTYNFYVQTNCGSGNTSTWAGPYTFTTTPANDDCSNAVSLTVGASAITGSCVAATQSVAPTAACTSSNTAPDVWYKFVAASSKATITVVGSGAFDAIIQAFNACTGGVSVGCIDATAANGTETLNLTGLIPGSTYYVRVFQFIGSIVTTVPSGSSFTIALTMPPIANGTSNTCLSLSGPFVSTSNFNSWLAISDFSGNIVAEINPQGNNLGSVSAKVYVNSNAVRQSGNGIYFMDRNIEITPTTQPTTPVKVRLYFKQTELTALQNQIGSGVTGLNDIVVTKINSICAATVSSIGSLIIPDSKASYLSNGYVVELTLNSFSTFYMHGGNTALPASINQFEVARIGNKNLLKWSTLTEQNNKGFEIQRSADGIRFAAINFIPSATANGNSNALLNYELLDYNALAGNNYYRLKQIDLNGIEKYSAVVLVKAIGTNGIVLNQVYPNPAKQQINITINSAIKEKIDLLITDITGKKTMIKQVTINSGDNNIPLDISLIKSGIYLISILDKNQTSHSPIKFVKE